ncbi:MAG: hypothetical protein WKG07_43820 [Hymenobacter sp.]
MRRSFIPLIALLAALPLLLPFACQQDAVVTTPTTPPAEGFVSQPNTPAPTSANTVDPVPARDMRLDSTARPVWLQRRIQEHFGRAQAQPHYPHHALQIRRRNGLL